MTLGLGLLVAVVSLTYLLAGGTGIYDTQKELAYIAHVQHVGLWHAFSAYWWAPSPSISWYPAIAQSHDFVSNPETTLFSPLTPLCFVMSAAAYLKLWLVAHLVAGFVGCCCFATALHKRGITHSREVPLAFLTFVVVLGPFVPQHIAIGYMTWGTFWLLPVVLYGLSEPERWLGTAVAALTFGLIIDEGGSHVAYLTFPVLVGWAVAEWLVTRRPEAVRRTALMLVLGGGVSAIRVILSADRYSKFHQPVQPAFSISNLLASLFHFPVTWGSAMPGTLVAQIGSVPSWDGQVFTGPVLVIALGSFAAVVLRRGWSSRTSAVAFLIALAGLVLTVAVDRVYVSLLSALGNVSPSLSSQLAAAEKYPFRMVAPASYLLGLAAMLGIDSLSRRRERSCAEPARVVVPPGRRFRDRATWIASGSRVAVPFGLLLIIGGAVVLVIGADRKPAWIDFIGSVDSRQALIWIAASLIGCGALALMARRFRLLLAMLVLVSIPASVSWWALGTAAHHRASEINDAPIAQISAPSGSSKVRLGERTVRLTTATRAASLAVTIPPGDVSAASVANGKFTKSATGGITGITCPPRTTCTIRIVRPSLLLPFAFSALVSLALLVVVGLELLRARRRGPAGSASLSANRHNTRTAPVS